MYISAYLLDEVVIPSCKVQLKNPAQVENVPRNRSFFEAILFRFQN
jgi:hypothetical protein